MTGGAVTDALEDVVVLAHTVVPVDVKVDVAVAALILVRTLVRALAKGVVASSTSYLYL